MPASAIMVQGTASSVGKSVFVTALCRFFHRAGIRVAPFKAQNMALNAAVTPKGHEIARAQAVQAEAAGIAPEVEMNPILLKPESDRRAQVVVLGRATGSMSAIEYHAHKPRLRQLIEDCLYVLQNKYELLVIEGAGSPAEINLKSQDIVNMQVARAANAPVLLLGDIHCGGLFASMLGTLALLDEEERRRVEALVVNKFRGDMALLQPGLNFLTSHTQKPILGVFPYLPALHIPEEDSVALEAAASKHQGRRQKYRTTGGVDIAVIHFPHISNADDVAPLAYMPDVSLRFVRSAHELYGADLVILPGSKSVIADLAWLRETEMEEMLHARVRENFPILGVCGGCQMLGGRLEDIYGIESRHEAHAYGLGLLPIQTSFRREKTVAQVVARAAGNSFLAEAGMEVTGYEIHMGHVEKTAPCASPFEILLRNGAPFRLEDGAIDATGHVVGTMLHGIFENEGVCQRMLTHLRRCRGLGPLPPSSSSALRQRAYNRLEMAVRRHMDTRLLWRLAGLDEARMPVELE